MTETFLRYAVLTYGMGKVLPDLDMRLSRLQGDYQHNYSGQDYRTAAQFLYQLNSTLSEDCRLEDLPKPLANSDTYYDELVADEQYRDYCDEYAPIIFQAIAKFNEKMIRLFAKNGGYG